MQPVQYCLCRMVLFQGFCCNKYLGCLSFFIAFKVYHRGDTRQVSFGDNTTVIQLSSNEPRSEKTGLRGFRPGSTQTGLHSHRRWLET